MAEESITTAPNTALKENLERQANSGYQDNPVACVDNDGLNNLLRRIMSGASVAFGCGALEDVNDTDEKSAEDEQRRRAEMMLRGREVAYNPAYSLKPVLTDLLNGEEKAEYESNVDEAEFEARREIAAKVFGERLLTGLKIIDVPCIKCGMPLMKHEDRVDCQVCPELAKQKSNEKTDIKDFGNALNDVAKKEPEDTNSKTFENNPRLAELSSTTETENVTESEKNEETKNEGAEDMTMDVNGSCNPGLAEKVIKTESSELKPTTIEDNAEQTNESNVIESKSELVFAKIEDAEDKKCDVGLRDETMLGKESVQSGEEAKGGSGPQNLHEIGDTLLKKTGETAIDNWESNVAIKSGDVGKDVEENETDKYGCVSDVHVVEETTPMETTATTEEIGKQNEIEKISVVENAHTKEEITETSEMEYKGGVLCACVVGIGSVDDSTEELNSFNYPDGEMRAEHAITTTSEGEDKGEEIKEETCVRSKTESCDLVEKPGNLSTVPVEKANAKDEVESSTGVDKSDNKEMKEANATKDKDDDAGTCGVAVGRTVEDLVEEVKGLNKVPERGTKEESECSAEVEKIDCGESEVEDKADEVQKDIFVTGKNDGEIDSSSDSRDNMTDPIEEGEAFKGDSEVKVDPESTNNVTEGKSNESTEAVETVNNISVSKEKNKSFMTAEVEPLDEEEMKNPESCGVAGDDFVADSTEEIKAITRNLDGKTKAESESSTEGQNVVDIKAKGEDECKEMKEQLCTTENNDSNSEYCGNAPEEIINDSHTDLEQANEIEGIDEDKELGNAAKEQSVTPCMEDIRNVKGVTDNSKETFEEEISSVQNYAKKANGGEVIADTAQKSPEMISNEHVENMGLCAESKTSVEIVPSHDSGVLINVSVSPIDKELEAREKLFTNGSPDFPPLFVKNEKPQGTL